MAKVVHPSLCPILILLSRLKPSEISSDEADALDPFVFMPFIARCAIQSNLRVRVLASRALTGLVSNKKLHAVLSFIACQLPRRRNQIATLEVSSSISTTSTSIKMCNGIANEMPKLASFNSIHGILLQLCMLLDINCRKLTDISKKDMIIGELVEVLLKCSWIGNPKSCPCPTLNGSYLQVLDHMLSIARTCGNGRYVRTIRRLLLELSSQCLEMDASCQEAFHDPTMVELRRQAAASYFNCMFTEGPERAEESLPLQLRIQPGANIPSMLEFDCSVAALQEKLPSCLSDAMYEIRLATLKWLLQFLKSTESGADDCHSGNDVDIIHTWAKTNLQPTLMQLLGLEMNPKCSYYILRILFSWNSLHYQKPSNRQVEGTIYIGKMDCDSVSQFWGRLICLEKVTTHIKVREALLQCMGICVKRFVSLYTSFLLYHSNVMGNAAIDPCSPSGLERWAGVYECIDLFIGLIKQNSASSEPVNMRKAAAESMVASGLLEEAVLIGSLVSNSQISSKGLIFECDRKKCHFEPSTAANLYAHQILEFWFICIKVLEDEDVGLRQRLAMDIQRCIDSKGAAGSHGADTVPTQVEKVIESSFKFLSSIFGEWLEYFNYLSRCVFDTTSYRISRGDLVRRVFDKEIDNHHEEKLLICQICCVHMQKLLLSKSWIVESYEKGLNKRDVGIFLQTWRMRFLNRLILFANDFIETEGDVGWIGGIGNHKDAFIPLYANLLSLYALSQCPIVGCYDFPGETEIHKPLLAGLMELGRVIRPFLRNPLIYNLYSIVIPSYERMLGSSLALSDSKSQGERFGWVGFDPYFLR